MSISIFSFLFRRESPDFGGFESKNQCFHFSGHFFYDCHFGLNYYKLERIRNAIASQIVINYYKLGRTRNATASQFVKNYYKLERICTATVSQFVIN